MTIFDAEEARMAITNPPTVPAPAAAMATVAVDRREKRRRVATNSYAESTTDRRSLKFSNDFVGG